VFCGVLARMSTFVWCFNGGATMALVPGISTFRDPAVVSGRLERQTVRRARVG
jgi:hypothetical protein